eukprot:gene23998-biopygen2874
MVGSSTWNCSYGLANTTSLAHCPGVGDFADVEKPGSHTDPKRAKRMLTIDACRSGQRCTTSSISTIRSLGEYGESAPWTTQLEKKYVETRRRRRRESGMDQIEQRQRQRRPRTQAQRRWRRRV